MDEERRKEEEADRIAAEKEFLEKHLKERRMYKRAGTSAGSSIADSESETDRNRKRVRNSPETEKRSMKTMKISDTDEDEDDEAEYEAPGSDPIENVGRTLKKMRSWFQQPSIVKMVRKNLAKKFGKYLDELEAEILKAREQRAIMETRVEERSTVMVETLKNVVREELKVRDEVETPRKQDTFAQVVGRKEIPKISGVKGPVPPVPKLVVVREENKESEEVKKKLKALVKPSEIGLKVRRLNMIRNGVIIEAETEEGVNRLMENEALKKAGLIVAKPVKKKPVIMVYDVNVAMTDDEVKDEVYKRNMVGSEILEEDFHKEFDIKHKYKERNERRNEGKRNHLVVECSVRVRNWLRRKGRVFIEWESCRIKDYVDLARCYKCQRYGHVAKVCTNAKPSCSHCAGEHDFKECRKRKEEVKCINCVREKRLEVNHPASLKSCPVYEKAVKRHNEQIDYGV